MRLTRGRGWIGVLGALLVGIVALNVLSLSLSAGSGPALAADRRAQDRDLRASRPDRREALRQPGAGGGGSTRPRRARPQGDHLPERERRRRRAPGPPARHGQLPAGAERALELSSQRRSPTRRPQAGPTPPTGTTTTPPASTTGTTPTTTAPSSTRVDQRQLLGQRATRAPQRWLDRRRRPLGGASDAADRPPARPPLLRLPADLLVRPRPLVLAPGSEGRRASAPRRAASRSPG